MTRMTRMTRMAALNDKNDQDAKMEITKLNQQVIDQIATSCYVFTGDPRTDHFAYWKFAELIMEKCRTILDEVYQQTPLEQVSPLLTFEERILKTFYSDSAK